MSRRIPESNFRDVRARPAAAGEFTAHGEGLLRLLPPALAELLERRVVLRPGGFVRLYFQEATGALGVQLDREGEFRVRGRLDQGVWIRSPLLTRDRLREGAYRLFFPPGVDFGLAPAPTEADRPAPPPQPEAHAVLAVPKASPPVLRTLAAGMDFLAAHAPAGLSAGSRVSIQFEPSTGRVALRPDPAGSHTLRRVPGAGRGFALSAAALAHRTGGPVRYTMSLEPDGVLILTPLPFFPLSADTPHAGSAP